MIRDNFPKCVNLSSKRRVQYPSGSIGTLYLVTCPRCNKRRWVADSTIYTKLKKSQQYIGYCHWCAGKVKGEFYRGERSSQWKGGRSVRPNSYVYLCISPEHKFACMRQVAGQVPEHRLVMAEALNRPLESWEMVHHKNGIKGDNRIGNLKLVNRCSHKTAELICPHCGKAYGE